MAKYIGVFYTGTWSITLEVPDDFEMTFENLKALVQEHEATGEFNFQDGGASWDISSVCEEDADGNELGESFDLS